MTSSTAGGGRADARRNRAVILAVASQAFADHGTSVSLGQIAERAQVGAGTVYRHFPTKDSLMEAVLAQRIEELTQSADRHRREVGADALFGFLAEVIDSAPQRRDLCRVFESGDWPHTVYRAAGERFNLVLKDLFRVARDAGRIRHDIGLETVRALVTACVVMRRSHPDQDRAVDLVLDSIRIRDESRNEMPHGSERSRCSTCDRRLPPQRRGRPAVYCSAACRQKAHRLRSEVTGRG